MTRLQTIQAAAHEIALDVLLDLIADLTDPDPCSFDHHGYCQSHFWLTDERPCPHGRAQALMAKCSPVRDSGVNSDRAVTDANDTDQPRPLRPKSSPTDTHTHGPV